MNWTVDDSAEGGLLLAPKSVPMSLCLYPVTCLFCKFTPSCSEAFLFPPGRQLRPGPGLVPAADLSTATRVVTRSTLRKLLLLDGCLQPPGHQGGAHSRENPFKALCDPEPKREQRIHSQAHLQQKPCPLLWGNQHFIRAGMWRVSNSQVSVPFASRCQARAKPRVSPGREGGEKGFPRPDYSEWSLREPPVC